MQTLAVLLPVVVVLLVVALTVFLGAGFDALLKGFFELRRSLRATSYDFGAVLLKSPIVPSISVIYAAPDASAESLARVRRLLDLHYGKHEVVVVLSGASQWDLDRWSAEFHLYRKARVLAQDLPMAPVRACFESSDPIRLLVVDKDPAGVTDALNAALNASQFPVIGMVDNEAEFIPELLLRLVRPMLGDWEHMVAVCGVTTPRAAAGLAGSVGALESLRMWLVRCAAFSAWDLLLPVPGSCMLVKREAVCAAGGFRGGATELFMDLHAVQRANKSGWKMALVASPVSFRPAAASWGDLRRQIRRDQHQLSGALGRFGPGIGNPFFGLFCVRGLRPLLETLAYVAAAVGWLTGTVQLALAGLVLATGVGGAIVISVAAIVLRELAEPSGMPPGTLAALCATTIPENLGYRQIRNLWLVAGFFGAPSAKRHKATADPAVAKP